MTYDSNSFGCSTGYKPYVNKCFTNWYNHCFKPVICNPKPKCDPCGDNAGGLKAGFGTMADSQLWYLEGMDISKLPNKVSQNPVEKTIDYMVSGPWSSAGVVYEINPQVSATRAYTVVAKTVNGTHYFDVTDVWNYGVKNALVTSNKGEKLYFSGFVHVDVNVGICGKENSTITINGTKRGNIATGAGNDCITINLVSNGPEWSNVFRIATDAGNDTVVINSFNYAQNANDPTFQQQGAGLDVTGKLTSVYADLGKGDDGFWNNTEAKDTVWGGDGNDTIVSGGGIDLLYGGCGNDQIWAGTGADTVYGDAGNDTIMGGADNDTVYGGTGNDLIYGEDGNDKLYGDAGNDTFSGGNGCDVIYGGTGSDTLCGNTGDDTLFGGKDTDVLVGVEGNDFLDAGLNSFGWSASYIHALLTNKCGNATADVLCKAEISQGGSGNDTIVSRGEQQGCYFVKDGSDVITGGTGADKFYFGKSWGNDVITDFVAGNTCGTDYNLGDRLLFEGATTGANAAFTFTRVNFDGGKNDLLITINNGCGLDTSNTVLLKDFFSLNCGVLDVSKYDGKTWTVAQLQALGSNNIFDLNAADHTAVTTTLANFIV